MEKKYSVHVWNKGHTENYGDFGKTVFLVGLWLNNKEKLFDQNDIDLIMERLSFNPNPFDSAYSGFDSANYASNSHFDLSFFYSDEANMIYMSIICHDKEAVKILEKLLEDIKSTEGDNQIFSNN